MAKSRAVGVALVAAWLLATAAVLLFVDSENVGHVELDLPNSGNWRTDNEEIPCELDDNCGYGNINLDPAAYEDPSPLAIINQDYKEGQLNPFPGPKNWGPDSPISWLPEEPDADYPDMVRQIWPDYPPAPEEKAVFASQQTLRMLEGSPLMRRPIRGPVLVRRY